MLRRLLLAASDAVLPDALDIHEGVFRVSDRYSTSDRLYDIEHSADVVFLHGVGGHPRLTWQSGLDDESFWPRWLEDDLPGIRVLSAGYRSELNSFQKRGDMAIADRALNVADALGSFGVGTKPYVFVCHSMGGLLAKAIVAGIQGGAGETRAPLPLPQAILFLGTPHRGAYLADILALVSGRYASHSARGLNTSDAYLGDLHRRFSSAARQIAMKVYAETRAVPSVLGLPGAIVVPLSSASLDGVENIPIDRNHLTLARCASRSDQIYTGTLAFIRACLAASPANPAPRA